MSDVPQILLQLARLEQRVKAIESRTMPQRIEDDDAPTSRNNLAARLIAEEKVMLAGDDWPPPAPNKSVEGQDA